MRRLTICAVAVISCLSNAIYAQDQLSSVRDFDFQSYLIKRNGLTNEGCGSEELPIKNIQVAYADLIGDGNEEALVEATTCAMGNGGADIVEVFKLDTKGSPVSLKIDDSKLPAEDLYKGQFRTPRLEVSNGKLTRWFIQRTTGEPPFKETKRVITYQWTGEKFIIDKVQDIPQETDKSREIREK
jgi:hypothetical protein